MDRIAERAGRSNTKPMDNDWRTSWRGQRRDSQHEEFQKSHGQRDFVRGYERAVHEEKIEHDRQKREGEIGQRVHVAIDPERNVGDQIKDYAERIEAAGRQDTIRLTDGYRDEIDAMRERLDKMRGDINERPTNRGETRGERNERLVGIQAKMMDDYQEFHAQRQYERCDHMNARHAENRDALSIVAADYQREIDEFKKTVGDRPQRGRSYADASRLDRYSEPKKQEPEREDPWSRDDHLWGRGALDRSRDEFARDHR